VILIAFCFGALLEALAGFGTPIPAYEYLD